METQSATGIQSGPMPQSNQPRNRKNIIWLSVIFGAIALFFIATVVLSTTQKPKQANLAVTPASIQSQQTAQPTEAYQNPFAQNETAEVSDEPYQNPFETTPSL